MSHEEELRQQLYEAFRNRAMIYYLVFDELRKELGAQRAEEILSRAIYRRGEQRSAKYAPFAPRDLEGLKQRFLGGLADGGRFHQAEVVRAEPDALDIKLHRCPLKETWLEAGLPDEDVATLCRIAARIDNGQFEGAGFAFSSDTWQPGAEGCCFLHLRPGPPA